LRILSDSRQRNTAAILLCLIWLFISGCNSAKRDLASDLKGKNIMDKNTNHLTIPFNDIAGQAVSFNQYLGKVILVVNVASECGFTPQYEGMENVYRKYKEKGFVIIGFPANNFGKQEPGSDEEILSFCQKNFDVTFPLMSKISVLGDDMHLVYKWLTEDSAFPGKINWNFNKFLIDREGVVSARFGSRVDPLDKSLISKIEELLTDQ